MPHLLTVTTIHVDLPTVGYDKKACIILKLIEVLQFKIISNLNINSIWKYLIQAIWISICGAHLDVCLSGSGYGNVVFQATCMWKMAVLE